jgi:hypothetical protein
VNIWRFHGGFDSSGYAQAAAVGTWIREEASCPECGISGRERVQPLVIEWEKGSDVVGDFTSAGLAGVMITERVGRGLRRAGFQGFNLGPVEMVEDSSMPKGAKIVLLPYSGAQLYDLWVTAWVHADLNRSSVKLDRDCEECGVRQWSVQGAERYELGYDPKEQALTKTHTPRIRGKGILISERALESIDIFRIREFPAWTCCKGQVRDFVLSEGYSNAVFVEIGETFAE